MQWSIDVMGRDSMDHECISSKQTGEDGFTEEQWKSIDEVIQEYRDKSGR
jgi:hypothetical protein